MDEQFLKAAQKELNFEIAPCDRALDFEDRTRFVKMETTSEQSMQFNALLQQLPLAFSADTMKNAYIMRFPKGLPHTLMHLRQGGVSAVIVDAKHQIAGHASLFELTDQANMLNAFTAMSVVTGQFFLSQINNKMGMMNLEIEKILGFLYGDKRAELLAELNFVKYAHENYSSIMDHYVQRIATITSLQETKKVAMKDIEFYIVDLTAKVKADAKDFPEFSSLSDEAFQIKDSLELSMQLYVTSCLMEVYYAQNWDESYIKYLEKDISTYVTKCEKRILGSFIALNQRIGDYKKARLADLGKKFDTLPLETLFTSIVDSLNNGEKSPLIDTVNKTLSSGTESVTYYLSTSGNVYCKV